MEWDGFYIFYLQLLTPFLREGEKNITGNGYEQFNYYFSI